VAKFGGGVDFLGRGWSFPPTFTITSGSAGSVGNVEMVSDDIDIQQSLRVLFSTLKKERVMLPEYGCSLHDYVFDSIDSSLIASIKSALTNAILYFEPRIGVIEIELTQEDDIQGLLQINLTYTIRQTNTRSNMVYPFYLQGEGTNVRRIA